MHKICKTYISTLRVCIYTNTISQYKSHQRTGWHEDERTAYGNYCFNRKTKDQTEQDMELALTQK